MPLVSKIIAALALAVAAVPSMAQDPCATFKAEAASVAGFAGAKLDVVKSGNNVICEMYSADRRANLRLIVEPAASAGGLAMRKMLAKNQKDPEIKAKDETGFGKDAFSFSTKQQVAFSAAGKGGLYNLTLNRDAVTGADEERLRAMMKKLVDGG
ncbi:MAG: hypothetical protein U1F41_00945 [Burkholderiales bacterium]